MMLSRCFLLIFLLSSVVSGQSFDPSKVAIVHVYRQGRLLVGVSISADGNKVVSLYPQKIATFYLVPGYHEVTMDAGEISPSASFKAEAGAEYFFHVDYEHVVSATSIRDLKVTLSMEPEIADAVELREVVIEQSKLMEILAHSNPSGLEPKDATSTEADAKPAE